MKLIEIINKRCNCKVTQVIVKSPMGERIAYRDVPVDNFKEYSIYLHTGNVDLDIIYSADKELSEEAVSLLTDLIDVYVENRATWEIAENVSKSPDIYAGRATLDEMVKVTTNALVYSGLFDKAAVMFFNEKLMELRGIYMTSIPPYTEEQLKAFRNKRVPVKESIIKQLQEYNKRPDDIESHLELEDKIFRSIDNVQLTNPLIIVPMMTGNKIYGILSNALNAPGKLVLFLALFLKGRVSRRERRINFSFLASSRALRTWDLTSMSFSPSALISSSSL